LSCQKGPGCPERFLFMESNGNMSEKSRSHFGSDLPDRPALEIPADLDALAKVAVDAAMTVHRELGPGLLETAYEACLFQELRIRGIEPQRQLPVPLTYRGSLVDVGFRADLLLEGRLLIELKAVDALLGIHRAQVITYLKVLSLPLGLLINFNSRLLRDGLERVLQIPRRNC